MGIGGWLFGKSPGPRPSDGVVIKKLLAVLEAHPGDGAIDASAAPAEVSDLKTVILKAIGQPVERTGFSHSDLQKLYLNLSRFVEGWYDLDAKNALKKRPGDTPQIVMTRVMNSDDDGGRSRVAKTRAQLHDDLVKRGILPR